MTDTHLLLAYPLDAQHIAEIRQRFPNLRVTYRPCTNSRELIPYLAEVDALFGYHVAVELGAAPRLRWVQLTGAGYDYLQDHPLLNSGVTVTNAPLFARPIAEYVFGTMLALTRQLPRIWQTFPQQRVWPADPWRTHVGRELHGSVLGIVGFGHIGREVARLGRSFGMQVLATRRSLQAITWQDAVQVLPAHQLPTLLTTSDFVVICTALTAQSSDLIGAAELRLLKPDAYLINVARGQVIDEAALITALQEGRLAGAALDVFAEEPLPPDSPLFSLPNLLLTPHIAGHSTHYADRITALLCENLARFLAGEPLLHVIAPDKPNKSP